MVLGLGPTLTGPPRYLSPTVGHSLQNTIKSALSAAQANPTELAQESLLFAPRRTSMLRTAAHWLITAILASAASAQPTSPRSAEPQSGAAPIGKLEFSKRLLTKEGPDSLTIRNPNAEDLALDSIAVRTENVSFGFMTFHSLGLPMLSLGNGTLAATGILRYRAAVPMADSPFRFPARKTLTLRFPQYDPCVCKVSAAATIRDTVHFEVVFHYAGLSDTLMLVADSYGITSLRRPSGASILPGPETGWTGFDVTGKRRRPGRAPVFTVSR